MPEQVWFTPDGEHLFLSLHTHGSIVCGSARLRLPDLAPAPADWENLGWNRLAISPDGRWWATHTTYCLTVRHADPPYYPHWDPISYGSVATFVFSPASNRLATIELLPQSDTAGSWRLKVFDVRAKRQVWVQELMIPDGWLSDDQVWLEWSSDGGRLAFCCGQQLWVRAADDGCEVFTLDTFPGRRFGGVAFHPGSGQLAVAAADGTVTMIDPDNGRAGGTFRWGDEPLTAVGFSPDGTLGVAGSQHGGVVVWDAV